MSTPRDDLRASILAFLEANPGASTTDVRRAVPGRAAGIRETLEELEEAGDVRNDGNGRAHAWQRVGGDSRGPGEAPEQLPQAFADAVAGVRVARWIAPKDTAALLRTTPRNLRRWEDRGLPSASSGQRRKRYPFPHAIIWTVEFRAASKEAVGRTDLPIPVALARDRLRQLEQTGEHGHVPA